uniref:IGFBP-related protein 1 n=1 Tax=Atlantoscia floridana TaxID=1036023 RepID=A0A3G4TDK9_9CRUS|nr:IGFBP-related protein 1 [Atlantoscia floridana]
MLRNILLSFLLLCLISIRHLSAEEECEKCDRLECPLVTFCPTGVTQDKCGCCDICLQRLGEKCDYAPEGEDVVKVVNGQCGEFLTCTKDGVCECAEEGQVCGSDDVTYNSLCEIMEKTAEDNALTVVDREPCRKGPLIKSPPKDASRPVESILVLDCEAVGYPVPVLTWELYRPDGSTVQLPSDDSLVAVQVRGGPEKHMVTGWVQIMKVLPENVGIYTCIATNSQGVAKASAKVSFSKGKVPKKF